MAFFLTLKAKADLLDIARYTQKEWGIKQRNAYLTQLDNAFHTLANAPKKGGNCDLIRKGYRKFAIEKHLIFYRLVDSTDIEIVRILHVSMDSEKQLGKE